MESRKRSGSPSFRKPTTNMRRKTYQYAGFPGSIDKSYRARQPEERKKEARLRTAKKVEMVSAGLSGIPEVTKNNPARGFSLYKFQ
jgi:hypothetical protein